jgi:protein-tyrosine-phosphatase
MNLLYVCDYNFIRSPCAEIMTRENATQAGLELKVSSAGLQRSKMPRIKSEMCRAMEHLKYQTAHTPRILTPEIMSQQNLILCFTKEQRAILRENTDKPVFTLPEYVSWFYKEIRDPSDSIITPEPRTWLTPTYFKLIGKTDSTVYEDVLDVYLKTAKTIEKYVDKLIIKLLKEQTKLMQHPQSGNMQAYSTATH